MTDERWRQPEVVRHALLMAQSYRHWTGLWLAAEAGPPPALSRALYQAPFALVSHGIQSDPVLDYGNLTAQALWEMDWDTLTATPSRLTAEAPRREERARLLERVRRDGYVDDYSGVRISASGRRFRIDDAVVWNLVDPRGRLAGQAALLTRWVFL